MSRYRLFLAGVVIAGLLLSLPAMAQRYKSGRWVRVDNSLDSAVSKARKRTGGRVLSAETRNLNGRQTHVIRVLTKDGKVLRLRTDAGTGRNSSSPRRR